MQQQAALFDSAQTDPTVPTAEGQTRHAETAPDGIGPAPFGAWHKSRAMRQSGWHRKDGETPYYADVRKRVAARDRAAEIRKDADGTAAQAAQAAANEGRDAAPDWEISPEGLPLLKV